MQNINEWKRLTLAENITVKYHMKNKFIFAFQAENVFYVIWIVFSVSYFSYYYYFWTQPGVIETALASGLSYSLSPPTVEDVKIMIHINNKKTSFLNRHVCYITAQIISCLLKPVICNKTHIIDHSPKLLCSLNGAPPGCDTFWAESDLIFRHISAL